MSAISLPCQFHLKHLYRAKYQVVPSLAVRCESKAQCLLVVQQCQWSAALGKVPYNKAQRPSSSADTSRIPSHQALDCNQQDPWNWDPGNFFTDIILNIKH